MIAPEHTVAIQTLVKKYATKHGCIPAEFSLNVILTLIPIPLVSVVELPDLSQDAITSFVEYFAKKGEKQSRVLNVLHNIPLPDGQQYITLRDVVTRCSKERDCTAAWLRYRYVGRTTLLVIDEWLHSLGLKRGMNLN